jgi:hypothetical protein
MLDLLGIHQSRLNLRIVKKIEKQKRLLTILLLKKYSGILRIIKEVLYAIVILVIYKANYYNMIKLYII